MWMCGSSYILHWQSCMSLVCVYVELLTCYILHGPSYMCVWYGPVWCWYYVWCKRVFPMQYTRHTAGSSGLAGQRCSMPWVLRLRLRQRLRHSVCRSQRLVSQDQAPVLRYSARSARVHGRHTSATASVSSVSHQTSRSQQPPSAIHQQLEKFLKKFVNKKVSILWINVARNGRNDLCLFCEVKSFFSEDALETWVWNVLE